MLVIADATKPIALAGVMGGAETEVSPTTKDVILESALFAPSVVRKTARSLHLLSEASTRFERGIDPKMTELALDRAAKLLVELGKGRLAGGPTIVAGKLPTAKPITLGLEDLNSVLNQSFTAVKIRRWLTSLGCSVRGTTKTLLVSPPTWRVDLRLAEDLIEEVARLYGYDKLAPTHLRAELHPAPVDPLERMKERVRDLATQLGYSEVYTRETERGARVDPKEAWVIANPIDPKESVLRRSLLPNLERAAQTNLERTAETKIAVFEVGTVFAGRIERQYVGATHWRMANRFWAGDVAKGQVAYLVQALGLPEPSFRGSDICLKGADGRNEVIGTWTSTEVVLMGRNHYVRQSWEIALDALIELRSPQVFTPPQVFPTVKRDVALWVPDDLDAARLYATMQSVAPTLVAILPFDLYSKDGRRSVAFHLVFQVPDRTLTTREVDEALAAILRALEHDLKITPRR
jgi:phenylalanyl-tRNA synthetase beta chain